LRAGVACGYGSAIKKEVSVDKTQTPSTEHVEFDRLCERVEEFDYLPDLSHHQADDQPPPQSQELDQRILAGLVSPV
jgi:hypothetical protein